MRGKGGFAANLIRERRPTTESSVHVDARAQQTETMRSRDERPVVSVLRTRCNTVPVFKVIRRSTGCLDEERNRLTS